MQEKKKKMFSDVAVLSEKAVELVAWLDCDGSFG